MKHFTFTHDSSINHRVHLFITDTEVSITSVFDTRNFGTIASYATFKRGILGLQFSVEPDYPGYVFNTFDGIKLRCLSQDVVVEALKVLKKEGEFHA